MSLPQRCDRRVWLHAALVLTTVASGAQSLVRKTDPFPPVATASPNGRSEVPDVPGLSSLFQGLNAGITISGVHDSYTGWATVVTPAIGYTFNQKFSVDASVPIYLYRLAPSRAANPRRNAYLVNQRGEPGDVVLGLHAQFVPKFVQYQATVSLTLPSGDEIYGLSSGRVTADFNNHFERYVGRFAPSVEVGVGDSTTLVNRIVQKNYTTLGPIAHFQVGLATTLLYGLSFQTAAYEQLPIGDQKIYGPSRNRRTTVVTGRNVAEDNGFTNSLEFPLDHHTTMSAYYNRSLRLKTDSVALGITYVLRGTPPVEDVPMDDLFR